MSQPSSIDSERAVIGGLMLGPEYADHYECALALSPEHFYDPVHGLIYWAIVELRNKGRDATPTLVDEALKSAKGYAELGGRDYLARCC